MFRDRISIFPQFVKKFFYDYDISKLNLGINKTQTQILMLIDNNSEKSMSEISVMTGLEKSSFTRSVDDLVKNNFLTRKPTEKDRRIINLSLTEQGKKAAAEIKAEFTIYWESLISGFSDNEKNEFFHSLSVIEKYMYKIFKGK